jgi:hypothetical protein
MLQVTAQEPTEMVLRQRFTRALRWFFSILVVLEAAIAVGQWVAIGWSRETLQLTGGFVALAGGAILSAISTSFRVTVRDGAIAIRRPYCREVIRPISTVTHVRPFSPQSRARRIVGGRFYALTVDDGTTLAVVAERLYPRDDLSAFLALLPDPEPVENALSRRDGFKKFKVSAPLSVRACCCWAFRTYSSSAV